MKSLVKFRQGMISLFLTSIIIGFISTSVFAYNSDIYYITDPSGTKALTVSNDGQTAYLAEFKRTPNQEWRWGCDRGCFIKSAFNGKYLDRPDFSILKLVSSNYSSSQKKWSIFDYSDKKIIYVNNSGNTQLSINSNGQPFLSQSTTPWNFEKKSIATTTITIQAYGSRDLLSRVNITLYKNGVKKEGKFRNGYCTFYNVPVGCDYKIAVIEPSPTGFGDFMGFAAYESNICIRENTKGYTFRKQVSK